MEVNKFLVYDTDTKKVHVCGEDVHDSIELIDGHACYYNLQNGCGSAPDGSGTYKMMRFTGLLDIKGKEIYDAFLLKDYKGFIWKVFYKHGAFYVQCDDLLGEQLLSSVNLYCHVIGSIYENSELLEAKQCAL